MAGVQGQVKRSRMPNTVRARLWKSMRMMRRFTIPDLIETAEASDTCARKFVRALVESDYVHVLRKTNFRLMTHTTYLLVNDTGPQAPRLRKREAVVWDPNTRTKVPRRGH